MTPSGQSVRFFQAKTSAARLSQARAFLSTLDRGRASWIITPTRAAATDLLSSVLAPNEACFAWQRHTFSSLVQQLSLTRLAASGLTRVRGLGVMAVCARAVSELADEEALGRLEVVRERPGLVRALVSSLEELRGQGVAPEALALVDGDLAAVLRRYERLLSELSLIDASGVLQLAQEAVFGEASRPLLWLDVPIENERQARVFQALLARASSALVCVPYGDERTLAFACRGRELSLLDQEEPAANTQLGRLCAHLFETRDDPSPAPLQDDPTRIALFTSPGESREAVEIARRIKHAALRGVPFDRIAVALRAKENYRAVIEEALARAEIPAFFSDGVRRPDPAGRGLCALLECAQRGLSARAFAEYLSLSVVPRASHAPEQPTAANDLLPGFEEEAAAPAPEPDDEDVTPRVPRLWERLLVDAAVIGGRERWQRRLDSLGKSLVREAETLEADDPRRASLARDAKQLEALLAFATPILDLLSRLPEGGTWGEWLVALDALCALSIRNADNLRTTLSELAPLSPIGPVSIHEVLRLCSQRFQDVVVSEKGHPYGKVLVCGVDELLGRQFEVVFVPGLAEKIFPRRVIEDALLPDHARRALKLGLLVVEDRVAQERLKLRIVAGAATNELQISYPRFDIEHGRPRVPSFYGLEILRALEGTAPSFDELKKRADPGHAPRIGYPAPEDPSDAIDDAELDLAMLAQLFSAPSDKKKGAARYLLEASPVLARSLRFRARRWSLKRFSHADGLVLESEADRAMLTRQRLAQRPYSATALALYARCPYAFYLYAHMGLMPREPMPEADELDARQRGIVFHAVQRATLTRLKSEGLLPVSAPNLARALDILREELAHEGKRVRDDTPPAIERVLFDMLRNIESDLCEWLSRLSAETDWLPLSFELGFGLSRSGERDPESREDAALLENGVLLRGAIDLVEQRRGNGGDKLILRATDHKTGDPQGALTGILRGGEMLQPVLYALALESMFKNAQVESGRLYFCTSRGGFAEHVVPLHPAARGFAKELAKTIDSAIERGFLPAAPKLDACENCAYRSVCGPHEAERVAKKNQDSLLPLYHLRGLP